MDTPHYTTFHPHLESCLDRIDRDVWPFEYGLVSAMRHAPDSQSFEEICDAWLRCENQVWDRELRRRRVWDSDTIRFLRQGGFCFKCGVRWATESGASYCHGHCRVHIGNPLQKHSYRYFLFSVPLFPPVVQKVPSPGECRDRYFLNLNYRPGQNRRHIVEFLHSRQSGLCGLCGTPMAKEDECDIDHVIPKSKGGNDQVLNLQLTHSSCNRRKGNRV